MIKLNEMINEHSKKEGDDYVANTYKEDIEAYFYYDYIECTSSTANIVANSILSFDLHILLFDLHIFYNGVYKMSFNISEYSIIKIINKIENEVCEHLIREQKINDLLNEKKSNT